MLFRSVLPTMWYRDEKIEAAERTLRESGFRVFYHIRDARKVNDMTFDQNPLVVCSPRSAAAVDYRRFVRDYLGLS